MKLTSQLRSLPRQLEEIEEELGHSHEDQLEEIKAAIEGLADLIHDAQAALEEDSESEDE